MRLHLVERSLSRNKSRRWRQIRKSSVYLIFAIITLFTWAWVSLVFSPSNVCFQSHQTFPGSSTIFPWELMDSNEQRNSTLPAQSSDLHNSNPVHDLSMDQILFGIAGAAKLWPWRKEYVKLWWRPREMRGFVWLEDKVEVDSQEELPFVKVSEDISRFSYTNPMGHPSGIRIARIIKEAFNQELPDVRWFVMGDDDTLFAVDNLLQVLRKYDSNEMYYIGNPSESHSSNTYFSHSMSFGGGGIAISYPLAKVLSKTLDDCIERYPFLFGSDDRLHACISELGVPLTKEPGFHQFDIHGNALGILTAHPIAPFISMHHLDEIGPVMPKLSALDGLKHLMKAMQTEPSSFLQRSFCYNRKKKFTFSISSGYVVQVYPYILYPRDMERAEITFKAWNKKDGGGEFNFDTRAAIRSVCSKPYLFYLERIDNDGSKFVNIYKRDMTIDSQKRWHFCFLSRSLDSKVQQIRVISQPMDKQWFKVPRRRCCKLLSESNEEISIHMRSCQLTQS